MATVTRPQDKQIPSDKEIQNAIALFEYKFKEEKSCYQYYHLVIDGELPRPVCEAVKKQYEDAGWLKVECRTSSENGERGGLTGLILYSPTS